jgi:predicted nucleotidyltransferase
MNVIETNKEKLIQLCEAYKVNELYMFGSILTEKFNETSDIDLLISFSKVELLEYFDNYMDFKEELEKLLHRQIDLVEDQAIKNPIFRRVVDREKQLIYERKSD